jgi:hypothetical protein
MNVESQWTVYRTRFLVRARKLTEPLFFTDALGREHRGQPGDYLVESSSGFCRIAPRTIFEDIYVPLEPPPSLAPARRHPSRESARAVSSLSSVAASGGLARHSQGDRQPATAWSG